MEDVQLSTSKLRLLAGQDISALSKANERLLTLYKLSETIRSSTSREEIMAGAMDLLFDIMPADRGAIMVIEVADEFPEPAYVKFRDPAAPDELQISRTIVQKVVDEHIAILSRDAKLDSRFNASESILVHDIRSAMCVPLLSKKKLLGVLFIDTRESVRVFNDDDLAFASSFANELAMTLDNYSLAQDNIRNERLAAIGQTIAGLAHNIKNILQLAKGGIELMDIAIGRKGVERHGGVLACRPPRDRPYADAHSGDAGVLSPDPS